MLEVSLAASSAVAASPDRLDCCKSIIIIITITIMIVVTLITIVIYLFIYFAGAFSVMALGQVTTLPSAGID